MAGIDPMIYGTVCVDALPWYYVTVTLPDKNMLRPYVNILIKTTNSSVNFQDIVTF